MAGLAGAVAALAACLAIVGLYVVVRYLAPYLLVFLLSLLIMATLYIFIRRPEDARRLRRFLAERGREAMGRLWGWATQRTEVFAFWF
jgi:Flp pilus assembly protein TadB